MMLEFPSFNWKIKKIWTKKPNFVSSIQNVSCHAEMQHRDGLILAFWKFAKTLKLYVEAWVGKKIFPLLD